MQHINRINLNATHQIDPAEISVALDIGTTKVCAVIGRRNAYGKIEVLGIGKAPSDGVLRGKVSNIEKTIKSIDTAIKIANRGLNLPIDKVYVGIAGDHIQSLQHRGILTREDRNKEISQEDIDRLINDMYKLTLPPGDKILHILPQEYTVDNERGINDPRGMIGSRLEANFHIVTGQIQAVHQIVKCIRRLEFDIAEIILEPLASAESVLSKEEREAGVALIDIGGGTTDVTVYYEGVVRHTAVIPVGGNIITRDVKDGCTVMQDQAEKLKVKFGSAMASEIVDNRIITIPGLRGRDPKEISEKNLAHIIQARVEDILDYAMYEVYKSGVGDKLLGGVVLTGGGALLRHIDKLCMYQTGMTARVGRPTEFLAHGYDETMSNPSYSTALGLMIHGVEELEKDVVEKLEPVGADMQKLGESLGDPDLKAEVEKKTAELQQAQKLGNLDKPVVKVIPTVNTEKKKQVPGVQTKINWMDKGVQQIRKFFEPSPDSDLY